MAVSMTDLNSTLKGVSLQLSTLVTTLNSVFPASISSTVGLDGEIRLGSDGNIFRGGVGAIASAATTDIGSIPEAVINVTGSTGISSFGNTLQQGQSKCLIMQASGGPLSYGTTIRPNNNTAQYWLEDGQAGPTPLPYTWMAGDRLDVLCDGTTAGNNIHYVTITPATGQPVAESGCTGASRQAVSYTSNTSPTAIEFFCSQIMVSDWSTGAQGGAASGLAASGRASRLINVGNAGGAFALTAELTLSNQIGGTDGFTLDPTLNGGLGQQVFCYLMWDGLPNTPGTPPSANIGLIWSDNGVAPQNGWTLTYPFGALIHTSLYFDDGGLNRLKVNIREQKCYAWIGTDSPVIASGSNGGVPTLTAISPTSEWPLCGQGVSGLLSLQVRGSGTGTVQLFNHLSSVSAGIPQFDFTGDGSNSWSLTIPFSMYLGSFYYSSTDAGAEVRIIAGIDDQ